MHLSSWLTFPPLDISVFSPPSSTSSLSRWHLASRVGLCRRHLLPSVRGELWVIVRRLRAKISCWPKMRADSWEVWTDDVHSFVTVCVCVNMTCDDFTVIFIFPFIDSSIMNKRRQHHIRGKIKSKERIKDNKSIKINK